MKTMKQIFYGNQAEAQALDVYLPEEAVEAVFLYFHGGGLERGDKSRAEVWAPYLTERGIAVVSANYRMYPTAFYPDFILDAAEATAWTWRYMQENGLGTRLFVGGSSAGGYLSMMLCFDRRYLAQAGVPADAVAGYFHDAGQPTAHFNVLKNGGTDPKRVIVDETAPLYYVGLEEHYPPMRFIVSDQDMQNRLEQTMLMLGTMTHFGYTGFDHVVMHGKHCEYCGKLDENGVTVFGPMICDFIRSV